MTTRSWSIAVNNNSDAEFRSWGSSVSQSLGLVGLVQTADTGQINWTTAIQPGSNTAAGYEIWRFTDSTVFLKIEYGSGSGTGTPRSLGLWLTVGTGSNGSGTLTGTVSARDRCFGSFTASNSGTYQSIMSYSNSLGFFGKCNAKSLMVLMPKDFCIYCSMFCRADFRNNKIKLSSVSKSILA